MFAEELGGNANRKKAEEAKERRKRLKELQQKKAATSALPNVPVTQSILPETSAMEGNALTFSTSVINLSTKPVVATTISSISSNSKAMTAVEKAAEQRQLRAALAAQQNAAVKIQATFRGFCSRSHQRMLHIRELEKKLCDVETLRTIILKKSPQSMTTYILPTAMSTALVRQFLVVSRIHVNCRKGDETNTTHHLLLGQLLDLAVIPGLENGGGESDKNPIASWIDSSVGCYRLRQFLRCLLDHVFSNHLRKSSISVIRCLRALILGNSKLQSHCRQSMFPKTIRDDDAAATTPSKDFNTFDLIQNLRHYLICMRDKPIPMDAEVNREACFAHEAKNHSGVVMQLVLEIVQQLPQDRQYNQARLLQEILTVPLLAWRLSAPAINDLVSPSSQPLLVTLLQSFTDEYASLLNMGQLEELLDSPDLPMTHCAASGSQRLLANLLQLSRLIPACNGAVVSKEDFAIATVIFRFIAALVYTVPLATFLPSLESSITWISVGGNQKPIVLSGVILEQCKLLIVESYVKRMFLAAIDTTCLQTDSVLANKNEKDLRYESEWQESGVASAASLAAKEARIDHNMKFWKSSKWARKLTKGVSNLLTSESVKKVNSKKVDQQDILSENELLEAVAAGLLLQDTSSLSRQLAEGKQVVSLNACVESVSSRQKDAYSSDLLFALIQTYSILIARWGGEGHDDIVTGTFANGKRRATGNGRSDATVTLTQEAWIKSFLNVLCFSTPIVQVAWGIIQSDETVIKDIYDVIDADRNTKPIRSVNNQPYFASSKDRRKANQESTNRDGTAVFYLFLCTFCHVLIITDDIEIHDMDRPLPMHQIRRCIQILKKLLYRVTCIDNCPVPESVIESSQRTPQDISTNFFGIALVSASARTMRDLYDRSSRRPFCMPSLWTISSLMETEISRCKKFEDYQSLLQTSPVLRVCPYMVSFKRRLKLFERIITTNRVEIQGENSSNPFHTNPLKPGIPVRISRNRLLEDGIVTMNTLGKNMRQRIAVQYYNEAGARESGIDAGGLFKEFWTDLCAIAFDPNYALFRVTDSGSDGGVGNCLYPNPSSAAAHGTEHSTLFAFLGRIIGKALYEGITIHPKFAHFFLSFLKGDYNFLHMLPDLSTVDSQLYNNLMFLKTYDGDASDLALSFTVTVNDFGGNQEIPLIPNGANIDVTNMNKHFYIGLVAKYYVYDRIREQSEAMTRGLFEVVDRSWLRLFNEPELQVLISGASEGKLDVEDMKAHCHYAGGYSSLDRTVCKFWRVVATLDEKQQGALLRFVTSCERPPPLGFGSMNPPFTIQRVGILRDGDRLPTASTCFNVLKLPTYSNEKVLRQRLIYAIESGAGFELT
jgi:ubiquitin-protein ligase E3 C